VERVDAIFRRTLVATADLDKFLRGQPLVHHFRYVLEDVEAAVPTVSISAGDNLICDGMRTSIPSARQCLGIGVARAYAFLPRFNQNIFQHREGLQKFGGHGNQPFVRKGKSFYQQLTEGVLNASSPASPSCLEPALPTQTTLHCTAFKGLHLERL
jgi:hypothetical protein